MPARAVLLIPSDDFIWSGIQRALRAIPDVRLVGEVSDPHRAADSASRQRPDIVLLPARLAGRSTAPLLRELRERLPAGKLVVLATETPPEDDLVVMARVRVNACVLLRDLTPRAFEHVLALVLDTPLRLASDAVAETFVTACIPGPRPISPAARLSPRQSEVLGLLVAGLSEKAIANRMGIGPTMVGKHVERLKEKVEAKTRDQLVAYAVQHGLLAGRDPGSPPR